MTAVPPPPDGSDARGAGLLYEDDVVHAVKAHLESEGWTIESFALSHQHGDDIVATRGDDKLIIEAKGEGSSKAGSRRHGLSFTGDQVKTHVAVGVVRAMRVASDGVAIPAIALPSNRFHRAEIARIARALEQLGIRTYWVGSDRVVRLEV